jgi:hypothetical protein
MADLRDFLAWVFPYQPIDFVPNQYGRLPTVVQETLDGISRDTKMPLDWLENTAALVMDGLAGLQCLWYLHGAEGTVGVKAEAPDWVREVMSFAIREVKIDEEEKRKGIVSVHHAGPHGHMRSAIDWQKGNFTLEKGYKDRPPVTQTYKIGRWLERFIKYMEGSLPERKVHQMRYELKHRAKDNQMTWRISAHPYDILTMSYNRPWSSCMRPHSDYKWQYGILSDLAAGSAIMFFYRHGADQPAGRIILRPALTPKGEKAIYSGRTVYGSGPKPLPANQIERMLLDARSVAGLGRVPVEDRDLCSAGDSGRALSRLIYSDIAGAGGCEQEEDDYDTAYARLSRAGWPPPALDIGELRSVAEDWKGKLDCDLEELQPHPEVDVESVVDEFRSSYSNMTIPELLGELAHQESEITRYVWEELGRDHPHITADPEYYEDTIQEIEMGVRNLVMEFLINLLHEAPVLLLAYTKTREELSPQTQWFLGACDAVMEYSYKEPRFVKGERPKYHWNIWRTVEAPYEGGFWEHGYWAPDYPEQTILDNLDLLKVTEPEGPGIVPKGMLALAPEAMAGQLPLFDLDPLDIKFVAAVLLDEDGDTQFWSEYDEDEETPEEYRPAWLAEAARFLTIPPKDDTTWKPDEDWPLPSFADEAEPYDWEDFTTMER